jgi:hypothetical protein
MSSLPPAPPMKGPTKFFFEDENVDRLFGMVMALGAEISKIDEKLETVLDLLEQHAGVAAGEIAAFQPTPEQQARRDETRKAFVETLLAPFQQAADALQARAQP